MELDDLKELISFLKDTDITELQVEKEGIKVKIRRQMMLSSLEVHAKPPLTTIERTGESEEDIQRLITITCPIVGTFYRAPSPDAPPFADAGTRVKKGQVICIIEAMKLMNEIESEVDGVIVRALVENGQPVEYGEPLFLVEPVS
ncbi:MAG TPA: acetyl-CoA carboxylase biotin carboxyl carrier protein [Thermodesulfovibrionales bacterium]|nr:acetyl-CoA carboxylase biotin carboxyl carrier protein [Thermodesulfovibrionales bacterium]